MDQELNVNDNPEAQKPKKVAKGKSPTPKVANAKPKPKPREKIVKTKSDETTAAVPETQTPHIPEPEVEKMEVHHHPEVEKKGLKEYVLEGLMIFLAVMMGFVAENIRENITENSVAKEMAKNFYNELHADSVKMEAVQQYRLRKEQSGRYFIDYVRDSSLTNLSQAFYPAFTLTFININATIFEPHDGILNQLQNSGSRRYFKSVALQKGVSDLGVSINYIHNRNERELTYISLNMRPFILKHFDFRWYDEFTQFGKLTSAQALDSTEIATLRKPVIKKLNVFDRDEADDIASFYLLMIISTRKSQYKDYQVTVRSLLQTLRTEYPEVVE